MEPVTLPNTGKQMIGTVSRHNKMVFSPAFDRLHPYISKTYLQQHCAVRCIVLSTYSRLRNDTDMARSACLFLLCLCSRVPSLVNASDTSEYEIRHAPRSWCTRWWPICKKQVTSGICIAELRSQILEWRTHLQQSGARLIISRGITPSSLTTIITITTITSCLSLR